MCSFEGVIAVTADRQTCGLEREVPEREHASRTMSVSHEEEI